jgi:dTDP-4-amino-4,6-dideoxygalactose transaminase
MGRLISQRSKRPITAIVPVHLYGQMADMDPILALAEKYGLTVVEDACQAHGAEYFSRQKNCWMKAGSVGRAAAFSFYPGKNLGACGEAGAVTTSDAEVVAKVRMLRDHGQAQKYHHEIEGYNGRLDAIQAGFLLVKMPHLEEWNQQRREHAAEYGRLLRGCDDVGLPFQPDNTRNVHHLYVLRFKERDELIDYLKSRGIGTGIHYPIPLYLQPPYAALNYSSGDFPVATKVAAEIVSLPMYPHLTVQQQSRVAAEILAFVGRSNQHG